ncbi:MAG: FAD-dependent oxidoreductase [Chloroflexota bacterium]
MAETVKRLTADVLVIGGGIAGAFAAYRARLAGADVLLVDKSFFGRSGCSALASGVYPAYVPGDDPEAWLRSLGAGPMVNQPLFEKLLPVSYEHLMLMDQWGVKWVKHGRKIVRLPGPGRSFDSGALMAEGGPQMMMAVRRGVVDAGVRVLDRFFVAELLTSDGGHPTSGSVVGAMGFDSRTGEITAIDARATVVCTGPYKFPYPPAGSLLGYMPIDLGGDGIAFMLRAGATLSRLEMGGINLNPDGVRCAPGLESLMPSGAKFVDKDGRRFLEEYDPKRMEVTSRAMLYFAIANEKINGNVPAMDLRPLSQDQLTLLKGVIPIVLANMEAIGYDVTAEPVPYSYQVAGTSGIFGSGAAIADDGATTLPGLFAAGTCSDQAYLPGGHLPFCSVGGDWAGGAAANFAAQAGDSGAPAEQVAQFANRIRAPRVRRDGVPFGKVHQRMVDLVTNELGMILSGTRIEHALGSLSRVQQGDVPRLMATDDHELAKVLTLDNYTQVLEAILRASLHRTESRVAFMREDYPVIDNVGWIRKVFVQADHGELRLWDEPIPQHYHVLPVRPTQNLHAVFGKLTGVRR